MASIVLGNRDDPSIPTSEKDQSLNRDLSDAEKLSVASDEVYITPPDGGRGWLVVVACFMVLKKKRMGLLSLILTFNLYIKIL